MHIPRSRTITALIVLIAGMSAIQTTGALGTFVLADAVMANGQTYLQVQPASATITAGAFAKFDVNVVAGSLAEASLVARGIPPDSVAIFTPNAGVANPEFDSSLTIVTSGNTPLGNYLVTVVAILNGIEYSNEIGLQILTPPNSTVTNTISTTLSAIIGTTLSITVNTDQSQYQPNSVVFVTGQVTDSTGNAISDATVALQIDGPTGTELFYTNDLQTDSAGTFQTQVALGFATPSGSYTVFASASKPGYSFVTSRTTFVVGSSTTPSVIIKAVYAGDGAGNPTPTFTSGQTIWIWIVIQNIGTAFQGVVWIQVRDPNGVPMQIKTEMVQLQTGQTTTEAFAISLPGNAPIGVYSVNALVSDKLISQGGTFLANSETQFDLTG